MRKTLDYCLILCPDCISWDDCLDNDFTYSYCEALMGVFYTLEVF
ncbi:MAG: hypothetical protein Q9N62_10895 [Ghiorsea sp.]|nr:hypothetical protein [Ghiorsea sp.]